MAHAELIPKRALYRAGLICGLLLTVAICQYTLTRLLADRNAVSLYTVQPRDRSPVPAPAFAGTLKFAAYNIAHGRGTNDSNLSRRVERQTRLKDIAELLRRENVDIAILNEVDFAAAWTGHENQAEVIAREAGFTHILEQRNFDLAAPFLRLRFGNAILSRFPIRSAQFIPLPAFSGRERRFAGSKQGVIADVQVDAQLVIRVFAVHLESRAEATRVRSAAVIAACATNSPFPFFCLGDFNCAPTGFANSQSVAGSASALDLLLKQTRLRTIPPARLTPEQLTFSSYAPAVAIDWILIPPEFEFVSHAVQDGLLSDHRPVFAEVRK